VPEKAGVGSGILSMNRMVGATFGVAAIGALFQHLAGNELAHKLAGTGVSKAQQDEIVHGLGAGGGGHMSPQVADAARDAFIHAFSNGMWLSAGVAATGVLLALWLISPKKAERPDPAHRPEAAAEAVSAG
jgi:hypothetical protein